MSCYCRHNLLLTEPHHPAGLGPSAPVGNAARSLPSPPLSSYPPPRPDLISPPASTWLTQPRLPLHLQPKGHEEGTCCQHLPGFQQTFPTDPQQHRFFQVHQARGSEAAFNCPLLLYHPPATPNKAVWGGEANEMGFPVAFPVWVLWCLVRVEFPCSYQALGSLLFTHPPIFTRLAGAIRELYPSAKRN